MRKSLELQSEEVVLRTQNCCCNVTQRRPYAQLTLLEELTMFWGICAGINSDLAPMNDKGEGGDSCCFFGSGFQMFFFYNPLLIPLLSAIGLLALPMHCRVADQVASFQDVVAHRSCWLVFQYIFVGSLEMEASN